MHTYTTSQCPNQVSTSYTLQFPKYRPDKLLQFYIARSKVKLRSQHYVSYQYHYPMSLPSINFLHLKFLTNGTVKIINVRSLLQGRSSNRGHNMTLHTYPIQQMSLPSLSFLCLTIYDIQPRQHFPTSYSLA